MVTTGPVVGGLRKDCRKERKDPEKDHADYRLPRNHRQRDRQRKRH